LRSTDNGTFDNPDTIGRCTLFSCIDNQLIGFFNWDFRKIPHEGVIGHNCILPEHCGYGYGKEQIKEVMDIFLSRSTKVIKVTTDDHPFFIPAQNTYLSCGFLEVARSKSNDFGGVNLII
jgi:RimJ/RimL family protein N-acetyltransferase